MKKITFFALMLFGVVGVSQNQDIKASSNGTDGSISNPITYPNALVGCNFSHQSSGGTTGGKGSSMDSDYKAAVDLVIPAGEDFVLSTIEVPFLTFAPEDAPTGATVVYYEDAAGFPGTEIAREVVVPTILSGQPWVNPVAFIFETILEVTPFTFSGNATSQSTYWVEISMETDTGQATVFWVYTEGDGLEGAPMAQFNAAEGTWTVPDGTHEGIYNFIGECNALSVGDNAFVGFSFYPNPTSNNISLKSTKSIDSVSIFNLLGQKILDVQIGATTSEVSLAGMSVGTYVMKVTIDGQTSSYKVIKN